MGEFATAVQDRLCQELASSEPAKSWDTEYRIAGTPVDVAGHSENTIILIELEWRRADPADNTAKLFRHLDAGEITAETVVVFQIFTAYYDLSSGGVSSKRENAEFVGRIAAEVSDRFSYTPIDITIDPPKRGGDWPDDWESATDEVAGSIASHL